MYSFVFSWNNNLCPTVAHTVFPSNSLDHGLALLHTVAVLMLGRFFDNRGMSLKIALVGNMKESGFFSIYAFVFFLLRDIVGYGTISFPVPSGIFKLELPTLSYFSPFTFWASIPGALVLSGLLLASLSFIRKYCGILERSEELRQEGENDN